MAPPPPPFPPDGRGPESGSWQSYSSPTIGDSQNEPAKSSQSSMIRIRFNADCEVKGTVFERDNQGGKNRLEKFPLRRGRGYLCLARSSERSAPAYSVSRHSQLPLALLRPNKGDAEIRNPRSKCKSWERASPAGYLCFANPGYGSTMPILIA